MSAPRPDPDFEDCGQRSEGPAAWWEAPLYVVLLLAPFVALWIGKAT